MSANTTHALAAYNAATRTLLAATHALRTAEQMVTQARTTVAEAAETVEAMVTIMRLTEEATLAELKAQRPQATLVEAGAPDAESWKITAPDGTTLGYAARGRHADLFSLCDAGGLDLLPTPATLPDAITIIEGHAAWVANR